MQLSKEKNIAQLLVVPHSGNMMDETLANKIPVSVVHFYGWTRPLGTPRFDKKYIRRKLRNLLAVFQLCKIIRREKVNVVFTNTSAMNVGALAAKITGRKHYWYIHELGEEDFNMTLPHGSGSLKFMNNFSEKLFANSEYLLKKYQRLYPGIRMSILRNPIIVKKPTGNKVKKIELIQLLMLGQITASKGQHFAIEAVHILKRKGIRVQLNIAGSSDDKQYKQDLQKMISDLSIINEVNFRAFSNSAENLMAENDILLMCSRCEAFGRVTVEAMKLGLPVIGANTCGTAEIIKNKESGLLYENANAVSLANTIELLMSDANLRNKIIEGGKQRANEVSGSKDFYTFLDSLSSN